MKKIVLLMLSVLMLAACAKEQTKTTYTVVAIEDMIQKMENLPLSYGYDWANVDVVIAEYFQGQRVQTHIFENVEDGIEYTKEASFKAEYITVRIDLEFGGHSKLEDNIVSSYIANVFYLNIGSDTRIEFSESTLTQEIEP